MNRRLDVVVRERTKESKKGFLLLTFIVILVLSFLTWRWDFSKSSVKLRNDEERYNVLIYAPARSGSSFLGEIFNQHQEIFYLYEPLYAYTILQRLGVFKSPELEHDSLTLLRDAYLCDFTNHYLYLYFISHPGFSSPHFRSSSQALSTSPLCHSQDIYSNSKGWKQAKEQKEVCDKYLEPKPTNFVCQSRKQVAIKVLSHRLSLVAILRRLSNRFRLKVVHLVRDPRAIVTSRLRLGWMSWNSDGLVQIREICNRMRQNIHTARRMSSEISGKYFVLRYEDLARNVLPVVKKLFDNVGLELTEKVKQWIVKNTRWPQGKNSGTFDPFGTEKQDAIKTMSSWRQKISMGIVRTVEEKCESLMTDAGYRKVIDKNDLRRQNVSLLVSPSERVAHLFYK